MAFDKLYFRQNNLPLFKIKIKYFAVDQRIRWGFS